MNTVKTPHNFLGIPANIWAIGLVALLMNLSSIVIFSIVPIYLTSILGINNLKLGIFEGIVEAVSWFTRIFSGLISDKWRKRKPLLIFASALIIISRPIFACAANIKWLFLARSLDRVGNGLQASPREALVGDYAPKHLLASCYGLRQLLGVTGSLLGAIGIYFCLKAKTMNYSGIFWVASIPSILALIILRLFVKDHKVASKIDTQKQSIANIASYIKQLKPEFWRVLSVAFVFTLSHYSSAFISLQAISITNDITITPQCSVFQNLATMLVAYPIGRLADRISRRFLLAFGFLTAILANLTLGFANSHLTVLIGAALCGGQLGITQSLFVTEVAANTPDKLRGTAFGIYYFLIGTSIFLANYQTGWVREHYGVFHGFMLSSCYAFIALLCLPLIKVKKS